MSRTRTGVLGKRVVYNFEERARVKIVTFEGSEEIDRADIDTAMRGKRALGLGSIRSLISP